jgi:hypothetical protein
VSLNQDLIFISLVYLEDYKQLFGSMSGEVIMKKLDVVKVYSRNNEFHLVLQEHKNCGHLRKRSNFSFAKIKTIMKKEAAKPLLLLRTE